MSEAFDLSLWTTVPDRRQHYTDLFETANIEDWKAAREWKPLALAVQLEAEFQDRGPWRVGTDPGYDTWEEARQDWYDWHRHVDAARDRLEELYGPL